MGQPNLHPEKELFLAYDGTKTVGYLQNSFEPPLKRVVMEGAVHPEYLRQGIGTMLIERAVALSAETGYQVAHIPLPYGAISTRRLAKSMGFRLVRRHWEMRLKDPWMVPPPSILPEFTLRSFVAGDEKALTNIQNLAFSQHWGFSPNTVEEINYRSHMSLYRPEDILFITKGDEVIGFNWTRLENGAKDITGFIGMMGTHPEYRGLGLGVAVMRAGVAYLRGEGAARVDLTVDSLNASAHKIYRAGGFKRRAVTLWYERRF